jgi:hypothetical protein
MPDLDILWLRSVVTPSQAMQGYADAAGPGFRQSILSRLLLQ